MASKGDTAMKASPHGPQPQSEEGGDSKNSSIAEVAVTPVLFALCNIYKRKVCTYMGLHCGQRKLTCYLVRRKTNNDKKKSYKQKKMQEDVGKFGCNPN